MKMKKTINIFLDLDVEEFIDKYSITKEKTEEEIKDCVEDFLCGCDDIIYWYFNIDEVYDYYIESIDEILDSRE